VTGRPGDPDRADEAVHQLTDLLDGIQHRVDSSHKIAGIDERNRLTLLFGHAIFAMLVMPGFALLSKTSMSSPSFVALRHIPSAPYSLAVWIGLAGLVLAVATLHRNRRAEFWALTGLLLWYVTFSVSLIAAIAVWAAPTIEAYGLAHTVDHLDWGHAPAIYAPVVYAHLAYAMAGHMHTLWKLGLRRDRGGG
jgi:uncharacterized membrane protein